MTTSNQAHTPITCPGCGSALVLGAILQPLGASSRAPGRQPARDRRHLAPVDRVPGEPSRVCPDHGEARPSNWGGLFCPARTESGKHCTWTSKAANAGV